MQVLSFDSIGTHLDIHLPDEISVGSLYERVRSYLYDFEERYSRFREGNWLDRVNQEKTGFLDREALEMLLFMLELARETDGYFDPTISKRLTALGYGMPHSSEDQKSSVSLYGDYRGIGIEGDQVTLHHGVILEFGGVGKGYLIDVIRDMIVSLEARDRYLINFGGDIYGYGGWKIGLENPFALDECIGTIILDHTFFACSAGTKRKWGKDLHHLIDPHTGLPAHEVVASFVEVDESVTHGGMIADAYATTLCVMPWGRAIDTLQKATEISGVIVRHDGLRFQKEGSRAVLFG